MKTTWKDKVGIAIGATTGAGAAVGVEAALIAGTFMEPLSGAIGGGLIGYTLSPKRSTKAKLKNAAKCSGLSILSTPVRVPLNFVAMIGTPIVVPIFAGAGSLAGGILGLYVARTGSTKDFVFNALDWCSEKNDLYEEFRTPEGNAAFKDKVNRRINKASEKATDTIKAKTEVVTTWIDKQQHLS